VEALAGLRELKTLEINLLAFCLLSAGEDRRADSLLTISLSREPDQHEAYYQRGIVYERRSDTAQALGSYERAMQSATDVEDVYLRGARLYQALQRWSDAERVAAAWQAQFPNSALAPFFLGVSRIATQQYPRARDALERSVTLAPNNALTQFYLATAYRNLGRSEAAKEAARRAAYIDSTLALPYLELIYIAADADDRDGAVAATREYLRRAPGDSGMSYLRQFMEP
jgi:tetratricopeptide (TPR) repeat protein